MRGAKLTVVALAVLAGAVVPAAAHQTSIKYVDVAIEGRRAAIRFTVAPGDVTEPLGLPADATPPVEAAATPPVAAYVARWLAVGPEAGAPCRPEPPRVSVDERSESGGGNPAAGRSPRSGENAPRGSAARFVVVAWDVTCAEPLRSAVLDFRAFFAVDARHEAIATVHGPGEPGNAQVVRAADPVVHVRGGAPVGLAGWIGAGVDHIWSGRDHACFVLALLLVVMLRRWDAAGLARWTTRPPLATLRRTATIVTAFTVAHSLSLIAAALGWLSLSGRLVESLIAFSILYTAVENLVRPDARWRFALTFGFGLVHGLGFASALREILPADHVIAPLLGFNLGVEIGQLVIVGIALPVLWLVARGIGADRYRRWALPSLSIAIAAVAIKWLIERGFDLALPTIWGM